MKAYLNVRIEEGANAMCPRAIVVTGATIAERPGDQMPRAAWTHSRWVTVAETDGPTATDALVAMHQLVAADETRLFRELLDRFSDTAYESNDE